jgi:hypothetical protein
MQEYYKKNGKLEIGTGWSVPLILNIERISAQIVVKNHIAPRDGELYVKDIQNQYPKKIQQTIFDFPGSPEIRILENTSRKRAEEM